MPAISVKRTMYACCPEVLKAVLARIEASEIGYRLAKGTFWSLAGTVLSKGFGMVSAIVTARMLGKGDFGALGIIVSTVGLFEVFACFGLGLTATKYIAEYRASDPRKAGRIVGLGWVTSAVTGGLTALVFLILAPWLASHTLAAPHLAGLLRIAAIAMFLSALNAAQNGFLSGCEAFKLIAVRNVIVSVLYFPMMLVGVLLAGLGGVVWAVVASAAVRWLVCHLAVRSEARRFHIPLTFSGLLQELPLLWQFSLPAMLTSMMVAPVNWICSAMLVNQANGYGEMGIFSAASQWFNLVTTVPAMLGSVVLPILSERMGQNKIRQSTRLLILAVKVNVLSVFPLVALICLASPYLMSFYGDTFRNGWPTLIVVALTAGLVAAQAPVVQMIAASNTMWIGFAMSCGWGVSFVTLNAILVHWGALGLGTARLLAFLIQTLWMFGFAYVVVKRSGRTHSLPPEPI